MNATRVEDHPTISLVVPAYNEAACLPRLLDTMDAAKNRYRCGPEQIEVIVADNDSTDETPRIAAARECRVAHVPKRMIAAARNGGAAVARGEIVAFADADFRLHPVHGEEDRDFPRLCPQLRPQVGQTRRLAHVF